MLIQLFLKSNSREKATERRSRETDERFKAMVMVMRQNFIEADKKGVKECLDYIGF
ncbi:hypothetical protein [Lysinibacillus xylanilyticus]|uniref:Uncharacterized protein n=1 Tax=Lysinibacillus xylanilyticus TaxID=582475 RepID=A0ABT4EU44_9BACI|nr:hypothetical protein [Lysinibacillus xylanilyticus]MCY9547786.1 hypothetical protein [Lysinibacillus xylanilyticus]